MVARNEVAVPLNQKLPAVETTCVLKVSYLARQIPGLGVAQARFPANLRCTHQSLRTGVVRVVHAQQLASIDFFTVPTIRFQVLYVFLVLAHERRRILHFHVTAHPTAEWTAQQLREAFPFAELPRYLLRDRDAIFGHDFREQVQDMGICEVLSAPRSPWQRAYVERVIGSIRRECLDHVIVFHESSLRRVLHAYFEYYYRSRTHLSLGKDSPELRAIQPPEMGSVVAVLQVGGLHHRYERRAA